MVTLYYCQTSYASHKVRIYLAEKAINFDAVHIDLRKQEHITSDYRKINPNGTVPSLIDNDGTVLTNSTEIMFCLEEEYPAPVLLSSEQALRDLVFKICRDHEALHDPYIRTLSYHNIFMNANKRDEAEIERVVKLAPNHPNRARGEFMERAITGKLTEEEVQQSESAVMQALAQMQQYLQDSGSGFMVGDVYSIADCVCTASVYRIAQVGMEARIAEYDLVAQWYQQMKVRPSFAESLAPLE